MNRSTFLLLFVALLFTVRSEAAIIIDRGTPTGDVAGPIAGFALADDFILNSPSILTGAEFWSIESGVTPWNGVLQYFFLLDDGNKPSVLPLSSGLGRRITRTATGQTGTGSVQEPEYHWSFEFEQPVSLPANQRHWLAVSIGEEPPIGPGFQGHFWEAAEPRFELPVRRGTFASPSTFDRWEELAPSRDAAFRLIGEVIPEPSGLVCWGVLSCLMLALTCLCRLNCKHRAEGIQ